MNPDRARNSDPSFNLVDSLMDPDFANTMDRLQRRAKDLREQMTFLKRQMEKRLRQDPEGLDRVFILQDRLVTLLGQYEEILRESQARLGMPEDDDSTDDVFYDSINCGEELGDLNDKEIEATAKGEVDNVERSGKVFNNEELNKAESPDDDDDDDEEDEEKEIDTNNKDIALEIIKKIIDEFDKNGGKSTRNGSFQEIVNNIVNAFDKKEDKSTMIRRLEEMLYDIVNKVNNGREYTKNGLPEIIQDGINEFDQNEVKSAANLNEINRNDANNEIIKVNEKNSDEQSNKRDTKDREKDLGEKLNTIEEQENELRNIQNMLNQAKQENAELQNQINRFKNQNSALVRSINEGALILDTQNKYEQELEQEDAKIMSMMEQDSDEDEERFEDFEESIELSDNDKFHNLDLFNSFSKLIENNANIVKSMRQYKCRIANMGDGDENIDPDDDLRTSEFNQITLEHDIDSLNKEFDKYVTENAYIRETFVRRKVDIEKFGRTMQEIVEKELKCKKIECDIERCNRKLNLQRKKYVPHHCVGKKHTI